MKDNGGNDFIVDIDEYKKPDDWQNPRHTVNSPRLPLGAKLLALWNLLFELIVGVPYIFLMSWVGDDFGAAAAIIGGLLFACAHTAASAAAFKRYKRKYEVSAPKFVSMNALPLFLIGALIFLTEKMEAFTADFGTAILLAVFCVCFMGYSVVYAALLSAVLGIKHAVGKRKRGKESL